MERSDQADSVAQGTLPKAPTGIPGLDEITGGGLPAGRTTLVCGGPGCGKTMLAMEFVVHGARKYGEPGLFVSFEESSEDLQVNFESIGLDLEGLIEAQQLALVSFELSGVPIAETGEFNLDGLFITLERMIAERGVKRVVLDTLETLYGHLSNSTTVRRELTRILGWLKEKGVTSIVTAERGEGILTRHEVESYVSDCVLTLDHRVHENLSKRRIRVVKYRGSSHRADEFPFLIGDEGLVVIPITSIAMDYNVSSERISSGASTLDEMLEGQGFYRGSDVLVSGSAGCSKTTLAATFVASACMRGERCVYFSFEESQPQIVRNMQSVGMELGPHIDNGLLVVNATRPSRFGLEEHLISITGAVDKLNPQVVVLDPVTDFLSVGSLVEVRSMLARVFDYLRSKQITTYVTHLLHDDGSESESVISSLMDTWIAVSIDRLSHAHRRQIQIIKSRGMDHCRETRELIISNTGVTIQPLDTPKTN